MRSIGDVVDYDNLEASKFYKNDDYLTKYKLTIVINFTYITLKKKNI
jgi:hypothetical protein